MVLATTAEKGAWDTRHGGNGVSFRPSEEVFPLWSRSISKLPARTSLSLRHLGVTTARPHSARHKFSNLLACQCRSCIEDGIDFQR